MRTISSEGKQVLTKNDLAKYPFMKTKASDYMKPLGLQIEELSKPEFEPTLDRAEERIRDAINERKVSRQLHNEDIEISSFPIAVMLVDSMADAQLKKIYALAEAKRASELLRDESKEKIIEIAKNFNWKIKPPGNGEPFFRLHFTDFLRNATVFREKRWKLVNRVLLNGEIYLGQRDVARLLEEEVRRHIEERLEIRVGSLPQNLMSRVERLRQLFFVKRGKVPIEELPKGVIITAFPPCIKALYDATKSGGRVSHIGRFALSSFLLNIGMSAEEVVDLFRSSPDFNERLARYQVEHIAGRKGSRTRYIPPRCSTLRTHGVCPAMDETCRKVRHPLAYYRGKLRSMKTTTPKQQT